MFHWIEIRALLARFLFFFSLSFLIPLCFAVCLQEDPFPFATSFAITLACALFLFLSAKNGTREMRRREGILSVVLLWIISAIFASLPFALNQTSLLNAYFEAMSALTTTGSTLYSDVESLSRPILLWRSLLQWIGGIGIVVLFILIFPALRVGGKILYEAEATGPTKDAISSLAKVAARKITLLYGALTIACLILLTIANPDLPIFDAINLSLTTISTGGFSIKNQSIDAYPSDSIRAVLLLFMILGSINFSLYFQLFRKKSPDLQFFLWSLLIGSLAVSLWLPFDAAKNGIFQAVAIQTTTGYTISNPFPWPLGAKAIFLVLMFIGGMAGSTAGGIKTSRFYLLFQILHYRLEALFRPSIIRTLQIEGREINDQGAMTLLTFFCLVGFFIAFGSVAFIFDGIDPTHALQLTASFLNNVGYNPPLDHFSAISKVLSIFWMLLGRLEYFVILLLFFPFFWKN